MRGHRDSAKYDAKLTESDLAKFGNLVELLWHRVKGWNRDLENHVQSGPECLMFYYFSLGFFFFLWYFKVNCSVN